MYLKSFIEQCSFVTKLILFFLPVRSPKSWEFLVRLLRNSISNPALIKWENESEGVFRLVKKEEIAKIWAARETKDTKPKQGSYESFARILR